MHGGRVQDEDMQAITRRPESFMSPNLLLKNESPIIPRIIRRNPTGPVFEENSAVMPNLFIPRLEGIQRSTTSNRNVKRPFVLNVRQRRPLKDHSTNIPSLPSLLPRHEGLSLQPAQKRTSSSFTSYKRKIAMEDLLLPCLDNGATLDSSVVEEAERKEQRPFKLKIRKRLIPAHSFYEETPEPCRCFCSIQGRAASASVPSPKRKSCDMSKSPEHQQKSNQMMNHSWDGAEAA